MSALVDGQRDGAWDGGGKLIRDHAFTTTGERWGPCQAPGCRAPQSAHAATEAPYRPGGPYRCPDCVHKGEPCGPPCLNAVPF